MDTVTLIRRYITKNFDVSVDDTITIKNQYTTGIHTLSSFITDTTEIFDYDCTDVCSKWYDARLRQKIKSIYRYLDKYRVRLGSINWEVLDINDNKLEIREMVKHFDGVYGEKFIRKVQNDWYLEKINKNTLEKLGLS